jgi:hypothetical protein
MNGFLSLRTPIADRQGLLLLLLSFAACAPAPGLEAVDRPEAISSAITTCPVGYSADCEPEELCFGGFPPSCRIKTVCTCIENDPFPIPFPAMPNHGSPPLSRLQLISITTVGDPVEPLAKQFSAFVVGSNWLKEVTKDYGGLMSATSTNVVLPAFQPGLVSVPGWLLTQLQQGTLTLPADPTGVLLMTYVPYANCAGQSSYHNAITYAGIQVAFAEICEFENLSAQYGGSMGHEIIETITNPYSTNENPGPSANGGYYFNGDNAPWGFVPSEVADACNLTTTEGPWQLAGAWSNVAAASGGSPCVPYPPTATYYNVSPSGTMFWNQWNNTPVAVPQGSSVSVTLTGWASPSTTDTWNLSTAQTELNGPGHFDAQPLLSASTIKQGSSVTLTFSSKLSDPKGSTAFVQVISGGPHGSGTGYWPFEVRVQ